jgi:hypothetical protein
MSRERLKHALGEYCGEVCDDPLGICSQVLGFLDKLVGEQIVVCVFECAFILLIFTHHSLSFLLLTKDTTSNKRSRTSDYTPFTPLSPPFAPPLPPYHNDGRGEAVIGNSEAENDVTKREDNNTYAEEGEHQSHAGEETRDPFDIFLDHLVCYACVCVEC